MNKWEKLREALQDMREVAEDMTQLELGKGNMRNRDIHYAEHKMLNNILFLMEDIENKELVEDTHEHINRDSKYQIYADLAYVQGNLRYGHLELTVSKENWDSLSPEEQEEYIQEEGNLVIDSYSSEGYGGITDIRIVEVSEI